MERTETWRGRSHPILLAAIIGALVGLADTILVEAGGVLLHTDSKAATLMLLPSDMLGDPTIHGRFALSAGVLLVEVAGNVMGYALLFAIPVAAIVAIRRIFSRRASGR